MAKKPTPIITHTEIINRAIHSIEDEIEGWRLQCKGLPQGKREEMFNAATAALRIKLETLKQMYTIETGAEHV